MKIAPRTRSEKNILSLDSLFHSLLWLCAVLVLLVLGGLIILMAAGGKKAFATFGWGFFTHTSWNPVTDHYAVMAPLLGTVVSTVIAVAIAVPLAFGTAFWLTSIAPPRFASVAGMAVQLLAAVPSIIFGMWGFFTIVPFLANVVQPFLNHHVGHLWVIGPLLKGLPIGTGLVPAGLVLAVMIAPFITAVMVDVFKAVPSMLEESAYGLGATRWEVMSKVIVPWSRTGMIGAIVLGMGRALGETMAVTFVIGNVTSIGWSLFSPRSTVASLIALQFPESPEGSVRLSSLMALGFVLMVLSCLSLACARLLKGKRQ
ncbi:phosphate ABC transporter permease subunit PstC [Acetobacteraceae bacterium ESL0709]|nr:phosphate ABC transporter permease subunit PstC [Acetobacteraceae bacterium ESL0697]MDF7677231.1 phosphate ABC transporter permease subunit PstC [Acetobacteraceae bacterium ESL0709]